ncbi:MAG: hypothetical protein PVI09_15510 [Anaerolineae bacterium]|jgi:hypothetical protein
MIGDEMRSIVPWTRLFDDQEMLLAINTDSDSRQRAWVQVRRGLQSYSKRMRCVYSTDPAQTAEILAIQERAINGGVGDVVFLEVPAAGFVIYEGLSV